MTEFYCCQQDVIAGYSRKPAFFGQIQTSSILAPMPTL